MRFCDVRWEDEEQMCLVFTAHALRAGETYWLIRREKWRGDTDPDGYGARPFWSAMRYVLREVDSLCPREVQRLHLEDLEELANIKDIKDPEDPNALDVLAYDAGKTSTRYLYDKTAAGLIYQIRKDIELWPVDSCSACGTASCRCSHCGLSRCRFPH